MNPEIQTGACDGRLYRAVTIVLDPEEGPLYDYQRLRPRGILLLWWRYGPRWYLHQLGFIGDSVLKNGKLGKRHNVRFSFFDKDSWPTPREIERLPAPWRHLIRQHAPGRRSCSTCGTPKSVAPSGGQGSA
jgi:hypothetical protein